MATFKVLNFTKKSTTTGKQVANMELEGVQGMVSMWADHPHFAGLNVGFTVDGDIVEKGQYKTLYPVKAQNARSGGFGGKAVEKLMDKKNESIGHFQDNKEHSIMIASTASQATQILVALIGKGALDAEDAKAWDTQWIEIRYWLVKNWSNVEKKMLANGVEYPQNNFPENTPF